MTKLSIITINFNNCNGLRKTIESVVNQSSQDFDYIVIDGGSTDGSVDVIKEYANHIDYWVSEPDKGIYNAMNKGVTEANGNFCQFLNSGDILFSRHVVERVLPNLTTDIDILSGYTIKDYGNGKKVRNESNSPDFVTNTFIMCHWISHPSAFIKTSLLKDHPYNEDYRIVSDWVFFVEAIVKWNAVYKHIPYDIAIFNTEGISSTNGMAAEREREDFLKRISAHYIVSELFDLPSDLLLTFTKIRNSYRFKTILSMIVRTAANLYLRINKFRHN